MDGGPFEIEAAESIIRASDLRKTVGLLEKRSTPNYRD